MSIRPVYLGAIVCILAAASAAQRPPLPRGGGGHGRGSSFGDLRVIDQGKKRARVQVFPIRSCTVTFGMSNRKGAITIVSDKKTFRFKVGKAERHPHGLTLLKHVQIVGNSRGVGDGRYVSNPAGGRRLLLRIKVQHGPLYVATYRWATPG